MIARRTQEEAERLYAENQRLSGLFYRKYAWFARFPDMRPEDIMQHIRLALWMSAKEFDADKGYTFSTFAGKAVFNHLWKLRRGRNLPRRAEDNRLISLDTPVSAEADTIIVDLLPSGKDMEASCVASMDFEAHRDRLKPKEQEALDLRMSGMTQSEIAAQIGRSQMYVSRALKKAAAFAAD